MNTTEQLTQYKKPLFSIKTIVIATATIIAVSLSFRQLLTQSTELNHQQQLEIFTPEELNQRIIVRNHSLRLFLEIPNLEIEELNQDEKDIVTDFVNRTGFYAENTGSVSNQFNLSSLASSVFVEPFQFNHTNALMDQMVMLHAFITKIELKMINSEFSDRVLILDDQLFTTAKPLLVAIESADMTDLISLKLEVEKRISEIKLEILAFK
jgi:hypothetical protein